MECNNFLGQHLRLRKWRQEGIDFSFELMLPQSGKELDETKNLYHKNNNSSLLLTHLLQIMFR